MSLKQNPTCVGSIHLAMFYFFPPSLPLSHQTPPEDVRITSALIAAAKKTPVVTPPSLYHSIGTHVLLSHWSLAVSLYYFYKGSVTSKSIDRTLMSAGYLKGPFQTMKKVCDGGGQWERWRDNGIGLATFCVSNKLRE